MSNVSKEEIKKLAALTKLSIKDEELESIQKQLNDVLNYAQRVQLIAKDIAIPSDKNINHDRDDVVVQSSNVEILAQAPEQEDNYFVVPKIVDSE